MPGAADSMSPQAQRFLAATASEAWLSLPELVNCLASAGYWPRGNFITAAAREAHVREHLATLRDEAGELQFTSLDIYIDNTLTTVYKQARLLRRGAR